MTAPSNIQKRKTVKIMISTSDIFEARLPFLDSIFSEWVIDY